MRMEPRIEISSEKKLIGMRLQMSLMKNLTGQLWSQFGPRIKEIQGRINQDKISMQVYDSNYDENFGPQREFTKWACVEVHDLDHLPIGMESYILKEGQYAVFDYKGSSADHSIYEYIFKEWIPRSSYEIDDRPHFEVLGEKYQNNDPHSEEEIWIPIR